MAKINVTLFHADWCGHCVKFIPDWKKLEEYFENDPSVNLNAVEQNDPNFSSDSRINGDNIKGFPTIRIKVGNKETEYNNKRELSALIETIKELKGAVQDGGKRRVNKSCSNEKEVMKIKTNSKGLRARSKKTKTNSKGKGMKGGSKKSKTNSKGKGMKGNSKEAKTNSKGKAKKAMKGGANLEGMSEQQMRELLFHKISKYEQKYNQLYKDLRDKGIL